MPTSSTTTANLQGMMNGADVDFLISEIFIKGAKAIRGVYEAVPNTPVIVSTSGCSPCEACGTLSGLKGKGAVAVRDYYSKLIASKELMSLVDALNMNVSDHFNGFGMMDGSIISLGLGELRPRPFPARCRWLSFQEGDRLRVMDHLGRLILFPRRKRRRSLRTRRTPTTRPSPSWASFSSAVSTRSTCRGRTTRALGRWG